MYIHTCVYIYIHTERERDMISRILCNSAINVLFSIDCI